MDVTVTWIKGIIRIFKSWKEKKVSERIYGRITNNKTGVAILFGITLAMCLLFAWAFYSSDKEEYGAKILYGYMALLCFAAIILFLCTMLYIWLGRFELKTIKIINACVYGVLHIVSFTISIPILFLLFLIGKIAEKRAKSVDTLSISYMLFVLDVLLAFLLLAGEYEIGAIKIVRDYLIEKVPLGRVSTRVFIFIFLVEGVVMLFNYISIKFIVWNRKRSDKRLCDNIRKARIKDITNCDLKKTFDSVNSEMEAISQTKKDEIKHVEDYLHSALFKAHLLVLIIGYISAALIDYPFINTFKGDVINTLTVFTLIILYRDKRGIINGSDK